MTASRNRLYWPGWLCRLLKMDVYGGLPRWWQWFFPRWGNWGAPGWSAGRWCHDPADTDWTVPPADAMDALFREHDRAYQSGGDQDAADRSLVAALQRLRCPGIRLNSYRRLAMIAFTVWPLVRGLIKEITVKRVVFVLLAVVTLAYFACPAALILGGDVPPISVADFGGSPEASILWQVLAGQGAWGALAFAILGLVWKFARPYLDDWMRQRRLTMLWDAVTAGVTGAMQTYVDAAKTEGGGKLTEDQAAHARRLAREYIISYMRTQGIDVIREYGEEIVNVLIEAALQKLKIQNAALKAVASPLSALVPLPPSVQ